MELGFFDAGMDSLMAVELRNKLQENIGSIYTFPSTLAFDHPSINKLVQYFEEHIFALLGLAPITQKKAKTQVTVQSDKIAIIGLSCRFPGGANDPKMYWELLKQGYDGVSDIPEQRWNVDAFYDPDPEKPGKMYVRVGGFLKNVNLEDFDARFFGISPNEAKYMDPQQRLLLELTWEAFENAGINPKSLKGSSTGVFIGLCLSDYWDRLKKQNSEEEINPFWATGGTGSIAAGRISYFFGLQGPCLTLDTACSSSLVALNAAWKSLQMGESNLAVVGGVN